MNILITGANGQLGRSMQDVAKMSADTYFFTDVCEGYEYLDITDFNAIETYVKEHDIRCIVNCAAWTNVDAAETAGDIVETLNAQAPENLAIAMKHVDGLLVHISTDYVFGAEPYNTPCNEEMTGTPTGVYGLTKLHGEQRIKATGAHYIIIRTAWLYSEFGKNFVKTMLNLTSTKPSLKVVIDQCGTPTYARDLAQAIYTIVDERKYTSNEGVYHYSNEGVTSWFDFTKVIAEMAGNTNCDIQPCTSAEFPSPVKRPAYSVLDKTKIKQTFGVEVPYWMDSLKTCVKNLSVK
jgi:dTDP-4-dehydrorhamnose reductase